ncbi:MAG: TIGR02099 family protein, partial [Polaromonas sp. 28-63-22]
MKVTLWLVAAAWLLLALGWLVLHGWIVPRIGEFRPRLEVEASKALGVPVRIGQITATSSGLFPTFALTGVRLLDARGQDALRLPRVSGVLTPASLWGFGFAQLVIDQPELDVRRAADGKIYIGGLPVSEQQPTDRAAADWIFSQAELVIRGGTVRWTDEQRQAPPLALTNVDWVLQNSRHRHATRLDATPPAEWGERFSVRGIFRQPLLSGSPGNFADWSGQLYGEFARADLFRITQYASLDSLGVKLAGGTGALRAWVDVSNGRPTGGLADVALQGNLTLSHTEREGRRPEQTELLADKLDLAALAQIASRLPLGSPTHALVQSFAPSGLVETLKARWQGPIDAPTTYAVSGRATALSLAASPAPAGGKPASAVGATTATSTTMPGRPGLSGATVDFDITQDGGRAQIAISKGSLDFPGIFEESRVPLDQLSTEASWKIQGRSIEAKLRNLQFAND